MAEQFDKITESQEWIDGLVEKYSPNAHDVDCALQNMGLEIQRLRRALAKIADYPNGLNDNLTFATARKIAKEAVY
jgi:hypothetical protein